MSARTRLVLAVALLCTTFTPPFVSPATAGCGCDHPPPAYQPVMPSFGSPGKTVRIFAAGGQFTPSEKYTVKFADKSLTVTATRSDSVEANVPAGLKPGPIALRVTGKGYDSTYSSDLFTALPVAKRIPNGTTTIAIRGFETAVSTDDTILIPMDLRDISDATQFAFMLTNMGLAFQPDDVVFLNADGVDLTLFTLVVDNPQQRQWGSYFGWKVEDDSSLANWIFDPKVHKSSKPEKQSDLLTYWRHEFFTYKAAHGAGGSHVVDANGYHPDGTFHIDHDSLVLAIYGKVRDAKNPLDLTRARFLDPGARKIDLLVSMRVSPNPIEPGAMATQTESSAAYQESTVAPPP